MTKTFTQEDLLRYLNEELPSQEIEAKEYALHADDKEEYVTEDLETKSILGGFTLKAPQDSVDNILAYSRSFK